MQCHSLSTSLCSSTFQFLVGLERKPFNVHSDLAVQLSPVFAALINGSMVESVERRVVLDDIDEETFLRFCEFAYKGDFSVPPPKTVVDQELPSSPQLETVDEKFTSSHNSSHSTGVPIGKVLDGGEGEGLKVLATGLWPRVRGDQHKPAWRHQISRPVSWLRGRRTVRTTDNRTRDSLAKPAVVSNLPDPGSKLAADWAKFCNASTDWDGPLFRPYKNYTPSESLTEMLLSQARLYVFADRYVIESLRSLVLYKMRRSLASLKLFPERGPEVFLLVQYVYENTREGDDLRALLTQFIACMITVFLQHPDWDGFIRQQHIFTMDLLKHLRDSVEVDDGRRRSAA
ncbi:hypothetical protein Z517_11994 [Fonsecaea pedrosoi CBS 271.37]|uniref:Unplaced genomic scaffold supercont1.8, whole genome shotgun sequence n=1 Tax=Fonsecaea pedrosoi CBS 271.37 TaxID=1442368 RepID=A0A0D2G8U1_9EURO|nr:uncharacterized protein Z517_11994 [Fonsecaea pedrosoi CBS 271.37]KIW75220.1 hypothetical protein Z517_11994 [Fonsecaea pedrosoi CBS 271.37]